MYYNVLTKKGRREMPMTAKQMMKLLEKNGFIKEEGRNHTIFYNPITKKRTLVPRHAKDLGKGLEQKILKQAGLK